ncbi:MAG: helix-turn-helix domain-containing protein [Methylococcales bacterium]
MKTSIDYLNEAKTLLKVHSQTALAERLKCKVTAINHYYTGRRTMDDYTAIRLAELLGVPPLEVIAAANADRETEENKKNWWRDFYKKVTSSAAFFACLSIGLPQISRAVEVTNCVDVKIERIDRRLELHGNP